MTCPDTNRLVELVDDERGDPELLAHVQSCASCRAELTVIRELPAAFHAQPDVPEVLVRRVTAGLAQAQDGGGGRVPAFQLVASGLLGAVTAPVTILATGAISSGRPVDILAFSLVAGLAAGLTQHRMGFRGETAVV